MARAGHCTYRHFFKTIFLGLVDFLRKTLTWFLLLWLLYFLHSLLSKYMWASTTEMYEMVVVDCEDCEVCVCVCVCVLTLSESMVNSLSRSSSNSWLWYMGLLISTLSCMRTWLNPLPLQHTRPLFTAQSTVSIV